MNLEEIEYQNAVDDLKRGNLKGHLQFWLLMLVLGVFCFVMTTVVVHVPDFVKALMGAN